jgi:hypothetical protein
MFTGNRTEGLYGGHGVVLTAERGLGGLAPPESIGVLDITETSLRGQFQCPRGHKPGASEMIRHLFALALTCLGLVIEVHGPSIGALLIAIGKAIDPSI